MKLLWKDAQYRLRLMVGPLYVPCNYLLCFGSFKKYLKLVLFMPRCSLNTHLLPPYSHFNTERYPVIISRYLYVQITLSFVDCNLKCYQIKCHRLKIRYFGTKVSAHCLVAKYISGMTCGKSTYGVWRHGCGQVNEMGKGVCLVSS